MLYAYSDIEPRQASVYVAQFDKTLLFIVIVKLGR